MMKAKTIHSILFLFISFVCCCCSETTSKKEDVPSGPWVKEIRDVIKNGCDNLKSNKLEFIDLEDIGIIANNAEADKIKKELMAEECLCPFYFSERSTLITLGKLKEFHDDYYAGMQYRQNSLNQLIKVGNRALKLNWKYNGDTEVSSICIVSGETEKPVYDSFLNYIYASENYTNSHTTTIPIKNNGKKTFVIYSKSNKVTYGVGQKYDLDHFMDYMQTVCAVSCEFLYSHRIRLDFSTQSNQEPSSSWECKVNIWPMEIIFDESGVSYHKWIWDIPESDATIIIPGIIGIGFGS